MDLFSDESDNEMFEAGVFDSDLSIVGSRDHRNYARINYMSVLSEKEFIFRFRLNKTLVNELLIKIMPDLRVNSSR